VHQGPLRLAARAEPRREITSLSQTTGIVLAGGRSERFGRDKLAEPVPERPLLHLPVLALAAVCEEVLVVAAPGATPDLPDGAARVLHDGEPQPGPLAGLVVGLEEASAPLVLVVGGDMPTLSAAVLRELADDAHETAAVAVALSDGDEVRPLPCALRRDEALAAARGLLVTGERSLRSLLSRLAVRAIPEESWRALDPEGETLRDVDRPEDLEG